MNLNYLKCIITGSSGQLGNSSVELLKKAGAYVIGVDVRELKGSKIDEFHKCDLRDFGSIHSIIDEIFKKHDNVNALVNNAGITTFAPFENRTESEFDEVYAVNMKGVFACIQAFNKNFKRDNCKNISYGKIINISSLYGIISPDPRIYKEGDRKSPEIYGASKAGVIQLTKYFAVHLAKNHIIVNSISPGGIFNSKNPQSSEFIEQYEKRCPMNKMGNEDDIANAVAFLLSDLSNYINGHNLVVDGGFSCW